MAASSVMHIFDQTDYSNHRLVALPSRPLQALAPSSLRLRSRIIGLTTNNLTYARMGHILGWWDIYPQADNTPAPFNDRTSYACIAAWGYADIVESTVDIIPAGSTAYGFLPISTLPEDVIIKETGMKDQIFVTNEHRQHLLPIYNRYKVGPALAELEKSKTPDSLGWDALMNGLFATAYNMNTYGFAWEDEFRIHPSGEGPWSAGDTDLTNSTVILLNASGKTGLSFAYCLRHHRPKEHQPKTIIGVGSSASKQVLERSGLYDTVLLNSDDATARDVLEASRPRRVVLVDFGARHGATATWCGTLSSSTTPFTFIAVGAEVKPQHPDESRKRVGQLQDRILVNASKLREKGIEVAGEGYFDDFYAAFDAFKETEGNFGMKLVWENGLEGWERGWEAFCKDEVKASTGLVYRV